MQSCHTNVKDRKLSITITLVSLCSVMLDITDRFAVKSLIRCDPIRMLVERKMQTAIKCKVCRKRAGHMLRDLELQNQYDKNDGRAGFLSYSPSISHVSFRCL